MLTKSRPFLIVVLAALSIPLPALALPHATARLSGVQEVPPVVTPATGTASLRLNETRTELTFDLTVQGLTTPMTAAHFHQAAMGVNGPVVRTITGAFSGNTASGVWRATDAEPLTPALVAELLAGNIYLNVHTQSNLGGEIRGQLDVIAGIHAKASPSGAQEVPPVLEPGIGTGAFTLTDAGLAFDITVQGLSGPITAAHFHNAIPGMNGGVVRTITGAFSGNTASGIWTSADAEPLTPTLVGELLADGIYVNIHTGNHPGGEIRGQVRMTSSSGLTGRLDGAQEVPPVATPGTGTGSFSLDEARTALRFDVTVEGLTAPITAAHFHNAAPGVNGPVVRSITGGELVGNQAAGVWRSTDVEPLSAALVNELLAGRIYVNFHTEANLGGEVRGQLRLTTGIGRTATLDGGEEVPPVATPATGTGSCVLNEEGVVFDATVEGLTSPMTAAHFHSGAIGVNGPVVRTLTGDFTGSTATGVWRATDAEPLTTIQIGNYVAGDMYMNVHTQMHVGGEIRGQLTSPAVVGIGPVESPELRTGLAQNYPNPFNPSTTIRYELAKREHVILTLHDLSGRQVAVLADEMQAGPQSVIVDARGLASGVYFYRIETPSFTDTRKLVLTK